MARMGLMSGWFGLKIKDVRQTFEKRYPPMDELDVQRQNTWIAFLNELHAQNEITKQQLYKWSIAGWKQPPRKGE